MSNLVCVYMLLFIDGSVLPYIFLCTIFLLRLCFGLAVGPQSL